MLTSELPRSFTHSKPSHGKLILTPQHGIEQASFSCRWWPYNRHSDWLDQLWLGLWTSPGRNVDQYSGIKSPWMSLWDKNTCACGRRWLEGIIIAILYHLSAHIIDVHVGYKNDLKSFKLVSHAWSLLVIQILDGHVSCRASCKVPKMVLTTGYGMCWTNIQMNFHYSEQLPAYPQEWQVLLQEDKETSKSHIPCDTPFKGRWRKSAFINQTFSQLLVGSE